MKKLFIIISSAVFCLIFLFTSSFIFANEIDLSHSCSLTLTYTKENKVFSDLEIKIYRIAELTSDLEFKAADPFNGYPVNFEDITTQSMWTELASTLRGYIYSDGIDPYRTRKTDADGKAEFKDLVPGLYLVSEVSATADGTDYVFYDSIILLPAKDGDSYVYDVSAKPKAKQSEPTRKETTYTVLKLWQDEGHTEKRPESVTVDILKNGLLESTVTLNSANNWTCTFTSDNPNDSWSVIEKNVAKDYTVKVTKKETSFIIINTWNDSNTEDPTPPSIKPPQTGDTFPLGFWMLSLCISGLSFIVLGVIGHKEKRDA